MGKNAGGSFRRRFVAIHTFCPGSRFFLRQASGGQTACMSIR